MVMLSSHPAFVMAQEKAVEDAAETDSGELIPHTMKATMKVAVLKKVILSRFQGDHYPGAQNDSGVS